MKSVFDISKVKAKREKVFSSGQNNSKMWGETSVEGLKRMFKQNSSCAYLSLEEIKVTLYI
jgi:hypothetical protein